MKQLISIIKEERDFRGWKELTVKTKIGVNSETLRDLFKQMYPVESKYGVAVIEDLAVHYSNKKYRLFEVSFIPRENPKDVYTDDFTDDPTDEQIKIANEYSSEKFEYFCFLKDGSVAFLEFNEYGEFEIEEIDASGIRDEIKTKYNL